MTTIGTMNEGRVMTNLPIDDIRIDGGTQARIQLDWVAVDEYARAMEDGATFPPVVVFHDGSEYWLADGFHRIDSANRAGLDVIAADVRVGTQRDAILYAVGANADHGVRRTNQDKRMSVQKMLTDDEWCDWSDREIARRCRVGYSLVAEMRHAHTARSGSMKPTERTFIHHKTGQPATMQTANIGNGNGAAVDRWTLPEWAASEDGNNGEGEDEDWRDAWEIHMEKCDTCVHSLYITASGAAGSWCSAKSEQIGYWGDAEWDHGFPCLDEDSGELSMFKAEEPADPEQEPTNGKPHVSHNSGNNEWYTPAKYIEAARRTMGSIDLDPASCAIANETVRAEKYFSVDNDGLSREWFGNVWMNPPYAQPAMSNFAAKMRDETMSGNVVQSCVLVNNATETKWFADLVDCASSICFLLSRVRFDSPEGTVGAPLQGQAVLYYGDNEDAFFDNFSELGFIVEVVR